MADDVREGSSSSSESRQQSRSNPAPMRSTGTPAFHPGSLQIPKFDRQANYRHSGKRKDNGKGKGKGKGSSGGKTRAIASGLIVTKNLYCYRRQRVQRFRGMEEKESFRNVG